ncbi:MAG: hypothetical protein ACOYMS_05455 [Terrimicrobiaceae bacterium]
MHLRRVLTCWATGIALVTTAFAANDDIVSFQPTRAEVREINGTWKIVDGDLWLLDFGSEKTEADRALEILRHYGMNQQVFLGSPARVFSYYLVDGHAPTGALDGEDAVAFDPDKLEVKALDGRWKIAAGDTWLLDFAASEATARAALDAIQAHGFDHLCYVGRPDASMTYLRASGTAAAAPPQAGEAVVTIRVVEGTATPAARPTVTLRRTDVSTPVAVTLNENPARFTVPAGTYEASAHVGASPETLPVTLPLSAGESKDLTINTATGTLEVALLSGGKTLTRCPNLNLFANGKLISASSEIPAKFRLPAGTFTGRLEFAPGQVFEIPNLTVTPGETARKSIEVPCANLTVKVQSRTPHPYVEVRQAGKLVTAQAANPAVFQLLAGAYTVGVRDDGTLRGETAVTLEAGRPAETTVRAD